MQTLNKDVQDQFIALQKQVAIFVNNQTEADKNS